MIKKFMWKVRSRIIYLWLCHPRNLKDMDVAVDIDISYYQVYVKLSLFGFGITFWEHRLSLVDTNRLRYR